jgi:hypothetical protein
MNEVTWIDVVTLSIALVSLLVGGGGLVLGILAEYRHRRDEQRRVKVRLTYSSTWNHPTSAGNPWMLMAVTNVGKLPVGIDVMALVLRDNEEDWLQFAAYPPNETRRSGAVLATGERMEMWGTKASVVEQLRKRKTELAYAAVRFTDGTEYRELLDAKWRELNTSEGDDPDSPS